MLDADIVELFKAQAANKGSLPYQTQINQALRRFVENANLPKNEVITMNMLDNPAFISAVAEKLNLDLVY
jgi:BrnA antitoxin of type II toxin-antitoxin system